MYMTRVYDHEVCREVVEHELRAPPVDPLVRVYCTRCGSQQTFGRPRPVLCHVFCANCIYRVNPVIWKKKIEELPIQWSRGLRRGFESRLRHGCLSSSVYVMLSCVGRVLATS
jgi:hypothetical protein